MRGNQSIAGLREQSLDLLPLGVTDFHRNPSVMFEKCCRALGYEPVRIKAVWPAIQRTTRIVQPHFGLQAIDLLTGYIGRV